MLLPDELTGPADKLNRLQKNTTRFVEWAEEQMEVTGLNADKLKQQTRKAYKTAQPAIKAKIDARLLESFCIGDRCMGGGYAGAGAREEGGVGRGEEELHQELHPSMA
jgi:hypothetical protein